MQNGDQRMGYVVFRGRSVGVLPAFSFLGNTVLGLPNAVSRIQVSESKICNFVEVLCMSKYKSDKKGGHVLGTRFLDNLNMSLFEAITHNFDCCQPQTR